MPALCSCALFVLTNPKCYVFTIRVTYRIALHFPTNPQVSILPSNHQVPLIYSLTLEFCLSTMAYDCNSIIIQPFKMAFSFSFSNLHLKFFQGLVIFMTSQHISFITEIPLYECTNLLIHSLIRSRISLLAIINNTVINIYAQVLCKHNILNQLTFQVNWNCQSVLMEYLSIS